MKYSFFLNFKLHLFGLTLLLFSPFSHAELTWIAIENARGNMIEEATLNNFNTIIRYRPNMGNYRFCNLQRRNCAWYDSLEKGLAYRNLPTAELSAPLRYPAATGLNLERYDRFSGPNSRITESLDDPSTINWFSTVDSNTRAIEVLRFSFDLFLIYRVADNIYVLNNRGQFSFYRSFSSVLGALEVSLPPVTAISYPTSTGRPAIAARPAPRPAPQEPPRQEVTETPPPSDDSDPRMCNRNPPAYSETYRPAFRAPVSGRDYRRYIFPDQVIRFPNTAANTFPVRFGIDGVLRATSNHPRVYWRMQNNSSLRLGHYYKTEIGLAGHVFSIRFNPANQVYTATYSRKSSSNSNLKSAINSVISSSGYLSSRRLFLSRLDLGAAPDQLSGGVNPCDEWGAWGRWTPYDRERGEVVRTRIIPISRDTEIVSTTYQYYRVEQRIRPLIVRRARDFYDPPGEFRQTRRVATYTAVGSSIRRPRSD